MSSSGTYFWVLLQTPKIKRIGSQGSSNRDILESFLGPVAPSIFETPLDPNPYLALPGTLENGVQIRVLSWRVKNVLPSSKS